MEYFNCRENISEDNIKQISEGIINSKIVIFPTETVYGIGANAYDDIACKKIFDIKKRNEEKALIVLISNLDMLYQIGVEINEIERKIMEKFWPGPLTIIFEKKQNCKISEIATGGKKTIGIRMTSGNIARLLIEKAGVPIVAPSANLSGKPTGVKIENIIKELGDKVDFMLDCGDIDNDITSTIVQVKSEQIYILRKGKITKEELEEIGEVKEIF